MGGIGLKVRNKLSQPHFCYRAVVCQELKQTEANIFRLSIYQERNKFKKWGYLYVTYYQYVYLLWNKLTFGVKVAYAIGDKLSLFI